MRPRKTYELTRKHLKPEKLLRLEIQSSSAGTIVRAFLPVGEDDGPAINEDESIA